MRAQISPASGPVSGRDLELEGGCRVLAAARGAWHWHGKGTAALPSHFPPLGHALEALHGPAAFLALWPVQNMWVSVLVDLICLVSSGGIVAEQCLPLMHLCVSLLCPFLAGEAATAAQPHE